MRLAPLLASLSDEELERLAVEHVRTDEKLPRPQLCNFLEGALRSYRFVNDFIVSRQPPTFAILTLLLDAPAYESSWREFESQVMSETRRVATLIDSGELLARDDQLRLYRRALYEARRNDLDLNASEAALLGLLRREGGIAQVEHFLIEHHKDIREFWEKDDCFTHETNALRSAGLIFVRDETVLVPEDMVPAISQTLGIDMPTDSARRLFGFLSNEERANALAAAGSRTAGNKDARLERMLLERIQPRAVLRNVSLVTLKDICRETNASVSGNKDDLVERVIEHFAQRKDQVEDEPVEPPVRETRRLEQGQFETLFSALVHQELTDILRRFPHLRQTGTKDVRIKTLWEAHLSEHTLLGELMNRDLENVLGRLSLKLGGSKSDRISRIVDHFSSVIVSPVVQMAAEPVTADGSQHEVLHSSEVLLNQSLFFQKAANPQATLQPWLDQLLNANGLVRCYATEDANPTKQLKNKLSQAAAARGGLLVLILADQNAFVRARDALLERWMMNAEWPKSIACVALAYPTASPTIMAIIERVRNPWRLRIQEELFPLAESFQLADQSEVGITPVSCGACNNELPRDARFCPSCGTALSTSDTTSAGQTDPGNS